MSLYDDASLIYYPSGYKEDKLYSLKPTDGSGDLTFTRASTATRVNADGLIETSPVNLLSYSEEFDNAAWTKNNCTITANSTTAPNGNATADLITSTGITETGIFIIPSVVGTNTWSVYAKKGTGRYLWFNTSTSLISAKFDLQDGVIVGTPSASATPSIQSVGDGWYRCIISSNTSEDRFSVFITNNTTTNDLTSSVGLTFYLWGAQLNIGATAKTYFPTTDRLNVPRIDYTGGGCGKLLLESQRTNLAFPSEGNLTSLGAGIVNNDAGTTPSGGTNAQKVTFGAGANDGASLGINASVSSSTDYILTFYAKSVVGDGTFKVRIDTNTTIGIVQPTITATSEWVRYDIPFTTGASDTSITSTSRLRPSTASNEVLFWGFQLESGSYSTSLINTTTTAVTRIADSVSKTGISSLIGQTEGTIFIKMAALADASGNRFISLSDGTLNNRVSIGYNLTSNQIQYFVKVAGVLQATDTTTISDVTDFRGIAVKYKENDFAVWADGVEVLTDASGITFGVGILTNLIMTSGDASTNRFDGKIQEIMIFPTALTDTQLATLTTL